MLTKALAGQSCVITAGTGSGKTESFLLPLLAYIARESAAWASPSQPPPHLDDWWSSDEWRDHCVPLVGTQAALAAIAPGSAARPRAAPGGGTRPRRLPDERARRGPAQPAAPRARLARSRAQWMAANRGGNRIYVGRYTGADTRPRTRVPPAEPARAAQPGLPAHRAACRGHAGSAIAPRESPSSTRPSPARKTSATSSRGLTARRCDVDGTCRTRHPTSSSPTSAC